MPTRALDLDRPLVAVGQVAGRNSSPGILIPQPEAMGGAPPLDRFVIERNLLDHIDRSPLRFHRAGPLEVRNNAWLPAPGIPALRFNNTDSASIDARDNRVLEEADLETESRKWRARVQGGQAWQNK